MSSHKSWGEFYERSDCVSEFDRYIHIHRELFESIRSESPASILEAGCGTGIFSIHLFKMGYRCVGVDKDERVLKLARQNNLYFKTGVQFQSADIGAMPFEDQSFDVVFSQGVLEHFSNGDIHKILNEALRVGKTVVFSVPHFFYHHKDFGNERLLMRFQWEKILRRYPVTESLSYYWIRRKRNFFLKFPQMYLAKIKPRVNDPSVSAPPCVLS